MDTSKFTNEVQHPDKVRPGTGREGSLGCCFEACPGRKVPVSRHLVGDELPEFRDQNGSRIKACARPDPVSGMTGVIIRLCCFAYGQSFPHNHQYRKSPSRRQMYLHPRQPIHQYYPPLRHHRSPDEYHDLLRRSWSSHG